MTQSLRARKKAAAMHAIQQVAIEMFEHHGFDAVTIEQIAAEADVSPSTIYRYFGTKEGLVLHDEFDDLAMNTVLTRINDGTDPAQALASSLKELFSLHFTTTERDQTARRTRLWMQTPAIRRAGLESMDAICDTLAKTLAATGRLDLPQSRMAASLLVWPLYTTIVNWYEAGTDWSTWDAHVDALIDALPDHTPGWT